MDAKQLRLLMPKDAKDVTAARELLSAGPDGLAPVVPEMLRHLKHHESPVSDAYAQFFAEHGERFLSPVCGFSSAAPCRK